MAKEKVNDNEGLTLIMKIDAPECDLAGTGKFIVGKENPKVFDFREEVDNNHKR